MSIKVRTLRIGVLGFDPFQNKEPIPLADVDGEINAHMAWLRTHGQHMPGMWAR